jgi:hypothetical protein
MFSTLPLAVFWIPYNQPISTSAVFETVSNTPDRGLVMIPVKPLKMPGRMPMAPWLLTSLKGSVTTPVMPSSTPLKSEEAPCSNPCSTFLAFLRLRRPRSFMKSLSPVMSDSTPARLPVVLLTPLKMLVDSRLPRHRVLGDHAGALGDDLHRVVSVRVQHVVDVALQLPDDLARVAQDVQAAQD